MIELVVRLAFSLAVVLGLVTLLARLSAKRFRGSTDAPIRVVHRQALSRGAAVSVVSVGSRVLVIGTTEQQVSLLTELDPDELDEFAVDAPELALDEEDDFDIEAELAAARAARTASVPSLAVPPAVSLAPAAKAPRVAAARAASDRAAVAQGVLAGSALSAQTWRQAFAVATRRQQDAS